MVALLAEIAVLPVTCRRYRKCEEQNESIGWARGEAETQGAPTLRLTSRPARGSPLVLHTSCLGLLLEYTLSGPLHSLTLGVLQRTRKSKMAGRPHQPHPSLPSIWEGARDCIAWSFNLRATLRHASAPRRCTASYADWGEGEGGEAHLSTTRQKNQSLYIWVDKAVEWCVAASEGRGHEGCTRGTSVRRLLVW